MSNRKKLFAIGLLALLVLVTWLAWPSSGFEIFIEKRLVDTGQVSRIMQIAKTASSRTDRFARHRSYLAIKVDETKIDNPVPTEVFGGALKPGDLVTLSLNTKLSGKWGTFSADFKADKIFEALIAKIASRMDVERYYLVVQSFKVWGGNESIPSNSSANQMLAYLYPKQGRAAELPYRAGATDDQLADLLAHNLVMSVQNVSSDCANSLCFSDMSPSLISLDDTRTGFDILFQGRNHSRCLGKNESDCKNQSEEFFQKAIAEDPDNDHASFGLGLIYLSRAKSGIASSSAYAVGEYLIRGLDYLNQARESNKFLDGLLNSPSWLRLLKKNSEFGELDLSNEFLTTADAYRAARRAMVSGNYTAVLGHLESLGNIPKWLVGHIKLLGSHAKLQLIQNREDALVILNDLFESRNDIEESGYSAVFGIAAAQWAKGEDIWIKRAEQALDAAVRTAHDPITTLDAMATRCAGLVYLGRSKKARQELQTVTSQINSSQSGYDYRSILLSVAQVYVLMKQYDDAAGYFSKAINYDPEYLSLISNLSRFKDFRENWPDYELWRLKMLPRK